MDLFVYLFLCAVGILAMLLIIAAIRALFIRPRRAGEKSSATYTPEEEALYAKRLSNMIKVPTISIRGKKDLTEFNKLQQVLREEFPLIHEKLERVEIEGNLLYKWKGSDSTRQGILLMGHQDVVTVNEEEWEHAPFGGEIVDGKVHGRGAMDCKCTVMAEFSAVEELLKEGFVPQCDVYLASSVDEEVSGGGAIKTVEYLKNNGIRLAAVLDEGGAVIENMLPGMSCPCAGIGIVEKGYMDIKITAKSAGGHSSTPPKHTPLARLGRLIADMEEDRPFKKKLDEPVIQMFRAVAPYLSFPLKMVLGNLWLFGPLLTAVLPAIVPMGGAFVATTFCFTMCSGAKTANVIPEEAYVVCNARPSLHQDAEETLKVFKKYASRHNAELEVIYGRGASKTTDINGDEFKYVEKCVNACFPEAAVAPYYMTGGTDCRNYEAVSDNCLRFCPIRLNKQQLGAMHAANENVDTSALAESVKFYRYYIQNRNS